MSKVDLPIREVVLLEDRAQVVRRGTVDLTAGSSVLRVADVTPLAADRTLTGSASAGHRVDEVRVERLWRIGAEEQPADAAEITREIRRIDAELRTLASSQNAVTTQRETLQRASTLLVDGVTREIPYAYAFDPRWEEGLEAVSAELHSADDRSFQLSEEVEALHRERQAVELRGVRDHRPDHVLHTELLLTVHADEPGPAELEVRYLVPCALWRPIHRAVLRTDRVGFECEAAVWQSTGEDWTDVTLSFSTARPTQQSSPPVLGDDVVHARPRRDKQVSVTVRQDAIATTGEGTTRQADDLPGVDDGGESRLLRASHRTTIRSDGLMRRVPVFAFEEPAEVDRICCPGIAPLVQLRSRQANGATQPLLAGPTDLVHDGGYAGRTTVDFVAPGERFALAWGSDDGLRVGREQHERRKTARVSGKLTITRRVDLYLSNLHDAPASFAVQERVPVSEIDKVKIRMVDDQCEPLEEPDEYGVITWDVELPARGTREISLVYEILADSSVRGL